MEVIFLNLFSCLGCPYYDPDFGCLDYWERLHCPQYVPPMEV